MKSPLFVGVLMAVGASIAACGPSGPEPGPAEMALVKQQIQVEMSAPINAMQKQLRRAARDDIYTAEMQVPSGDGAPLPLDWWLFQRGFIKLAGADRYMQGYFSLTPAGVAFVDGKAPWLAVDFQGAPTVTCAGSKSRGACQVAGTAILSPGPGAGSNGLKGAPLQTQAFTIGLEYGPNGWTVGDLSLGSGQEAYVAARDALFGSYETILSQRIAYAETVNKEAAKF